MPYKTKQLIFDCDNTLVLTEDLAFEACAPLTNRLLAQYNISDRYTSEELIIDFIGQNFRGMMAGLQAKYGFTMTAADTNYWVKQEAELVTEILAAKAKPSPGSIEVLTKLHKDGQYGLAVASSSALNRIIASVEKAGQAKFFKPEHIFSAVDSLPKPSTKPSPAVYQHAMKIIGVKPEECVAVEDSRSGVSSAIGAGVPCIAYVGAYNNKLMQDQAAETLLQAGCKVVMYHWSEFWDCLAKVSSSE